MDTIIGDKMHCIEIYKINPSELNPEIDLDSQEFSDKITALVDPVIDLYVNKYRLPKVARGWKIVENVSSEESDINVDDIREEQSVYTVKVFLNSDFTGGDIQFIHRDFAANVSPGDVLIYPSSYINAYKVMPVTSGSQKYLVNKYRFPGTAEG